MSADKTAADAIEFACCGDPGCRCETCPEQQRANRLRAQTAEEPSFLEGWTRVVNATPSAASARAELADYLLGDEYRRLLWRAIISRLSTTSAHHEQHMKAIELFEAAFPETCK